MRRAAPPPHHDVPSPLRVTTRPSHVGSRLGALGVLGAALALAVPDVALADPKDDARRHFAAGLAAAQSGDYEIALQRFLAAQEAYPHPATLYNIAKAYQDMEDFGNALVYYRLYRDASPEKSAEIDPIMAVLEARSAAPAALVTGPAVASGGTSSGVPTVDLAGSGATPEEIARIDALRMELGALGEAIGQRTGTPVNVLGGGTSEAPGPEATPDTPSTPDIPTMPEGGFLTDAYEKLVVTASRVGQAPLDSPSTITVISADDIKASGATQLGDVLRRVVGVDAMSLATAHTDIGIRGFNRKLNNKVLILVDGRSTYIDFIGITFLNGLTIQLEEIDRIEVIRGPGSTMYGANAVTGVINIITKTPGDEPMTLVKAEGGTTGYARGLAYTTGRKDNTSYRLSAGYNQAGRWAKEFLVNDENSPIDYFMEDGDLDRGNEMYRANGRIDTTFGTKGFASLSGGFTKAEFEYYNIGALPNYGFHANFGYLRGDIAWGNLHLRSFWNTDSGFTGPWYEYEGQSRTLDSAVDNDAVDVEIEGPVEFDTGLASHVLNLGASYRFKRIEMGYLGPDAFTENHFAAFVNEQMTLGKLGVVGSFRVDRHPLIPDVTKTMSPRAALIYRLFEKTSIRATAGTAFRAPNSVESYMDYNLNSPSSDGVYINDIGGSEVIGTKPLSPERITTFELGVHDESSYFHQADVVVYLNQVRDLINLLPVAPKANAYDEELVGFMAGQTGWTNLDETFTGMGVEADLELYPTDGLDVFTNVNIASIVEEDAKTGKTTPDKSTSLWKVNLGASYRSPWRTDLSVIGHLVGEQTWGLRTFSADGSIEVIEEQVPTRFMLTSRIGARPFEDEALELAVSAWNLTAFFSDPVIEHPNGQPVGGIAYGSISYTF